MMITMEIREDLALFRRKEGLLLKSQMQSLEKRRKDSPNKNKTLKRVSLTVNSQSVISHYI